MARKAITLDLTVRLAVTAGGISEHAAWLLTREKWSKLQTSDSLSEVLNEISDGLNRRMANLRHRHEALLKGVGNARAAAIVAGITSALCGLYWAFSERREIVAVALFLLFLSIGLAAEWRKRVHKADDTYRQLQKVRAAGRDYFLLDVGDDFIPDPDDEMTRS